MKTKIKKPTKCCHPDCFNCPYVDCRYERLEVEDFTETNNRDYSLYEDSTGRKLHKPSDKEYRNARQTAYQRRNRKYVDRHEYNQKYYEEHGEEIKERMRSEYDTKKNTKKCMKYAKVHKEQRKEYYRQYYLKNREKKLAIAKERYANQKAKIGGMNMEEYGINPDFKRYVDRYCNHHNITLEEAFRHKLVKEVEEEYRSKRINIVD